jgi:glutaredoxin 3
MKKKEIKIYSTSWCPSCDYAKRFFKEKDLSYEEINIEDKGWSRKDLFKLTGGRTVPQIVIDGEFIGGYDDLMKLNSEKKLNI